jgi:hypothetical protein
MQPPVPPTGHHIRLSDIAPDIVRIPWGKRGADVRPNFRRAVAGASIAPPPNLREMVEIVPPHRRAARAYLFRPATPTVRA